MDKKYIWIIGIIIFILIITYTMRDTIFKKVIAVIIKYNEGGYVSPEMAAAIGDTGGETNFGISKKQYPSLDIKNLTADRAAEIYYNDYFKKLPNITDINLFYQVLDMAINAGVKTALKLYRPGMSAADYKAARLNEYSKYKLWANKNVRTSWTNRTNRNIV
jgi:hypothetical protein